MSDSQKQMYALWDTGKDEWVVTSFIHTVDNEDISGIRLFFSEEQATTFKKYSYYKTYAKRLTAMRYTP